MNQVLVEMLRQGRPMSGEELGRILGISRAAVWKQINRIRERGFEVQSEHGKGYMVEKCPPHTLIPEKLYLRLADRIRHYFYSASMDSTNTEAKRLILKEDLGDILVMTDQQTGGRGRLGRKWDSSPGRDLTFTLGLRVDDDVRDFFRYTILTATAIQQTLLQYREGFLIKWPNDILWHNLKICGILSEMITEANQIKYVLIGAGVNVNSRPPLDTSTTLQHITGQEADTNLLLSSILEKVYQYLDAYRTGDYESVFQLWKKNLAWMDSSVRIIESGKETEGVLCDVNKDGSLLIRKGMETISVYSGDITQSLRPGNK